MLKINKKALVAMSGGVDSSVAAMLLKEAGFEVTGATMKLFGNEDIEEKACCSLSDAEDAAAACRKIGAEHHVFNFTEQFKTEVMDRFAEGYTRGETPNPCIDCNRHIKFPLFLERARLLGMDHLATGHYAQVERDPDTGRFLLKKAPDSGKDQSYVLYGMTQETLARTLFPLGKLTKREVRKAALEYRFINAEKPESQDICFVPDGDYAKFLKREIGISSAPGEILDINGRVLGRHDGIIGYTIGQRRGLGISSEKPLYVLGKDIGKNTITVGEEALLYSHEFFVKDINLISLPRIEAPVNVTVKTRYHQKDAAATLYPAENGLARVRLTAPQRAITSGQAAVFYDGDIVVGGGIIK